MATVKLSDELVEKAKIHAAKEHRSVPKQIEHWAEIGMQHEKANLTTAQKLAVLKGIKEKYHETFEILAQ